MTTTPWLLILLALPVAAQVAPAPLSTSPSPAVPSSVVSAVDPAVQKLLDDFLNSGRWQAKYAPDGRVSTLTGRPKTTKGPPDFSDASLLQLLAPLRGPLKGNFSAPKRQTIGDLQQTTYWQVLDGPPVDGATITVTRNAAGTFYDIVL